MAKPKLALIPAAQGDKFYSVLPSDGVGDFTFARASTGTRIAPTGLIEEVASGDSRLNYDLLNGKVVNCPHYLLEPARTNLIAYSEAFDNVYWTKNNTSVTSGFISPSGAANAFKLVEDTSNTIHRIRRNATISASPNASIGVFAKAGERDWIMITESVQTGAYAFFNIKDGYIGEIGITAIPKIENYGNGWFRCSITKNLTQANIDIRVCQSDGVESYQGDGTSGIYIFGAQLEESSYPTSYIPTNGTTITRAAETATGSGDAATFNDSEGVLMAEIEGTEDGTFKYITISDGSFQNRITIIFLSNNIVGQVRASNSEVFFQTTSGISIENYNKIAVHYKTNQCKLFVNGFQIGSTDTSAAMPSGLNTLEFKDGSGVSPFYGKTREVQYFDSALTDAQLETLTSWTSLQEMITSQLYTNY